MKQLIKKLASNSFSKVTLPVFLLIFLAPAEAATFCVYTNRDEGNTKILAIPVDSISENGKKIAFQGCVPSEISLAVAHPEFSNSETRLTILSRDENDNQQKKSLLLRRGRITGNMISPALVFDSTNKEDIGRQFNLRLNPVDIDNSIIIDGVGDSSLEFPARKYRFLSRQTPKN